MHYPARMYIPPKQLLLVAAFSLLIALALTFVIAW